MRVSDRVQVGDVLGEVIHIGFRATWVRTDDNVVVIVPNCELVENYVTNWSSNDRKIRHIIPVSVPSGSDSSRVSEVLLNATRQHPDVLLDPPAEVRLKAFHERGLDFELLVWSVATNHAAFRSEITLRAYQAFRSYGVIPTV